MSRRQDVQSGEGIALRYPTYGALQYISKSAPVGGEVGFAPGCDWYVPTGTGTVNSGSRYINIGSNGYSTGLGTANPTALWIQADNTFGALTQLGKAASSGGYMRGSGNIFADIKAAAGISPSATGADKIVAFFTIPANTLAAAGQGFQVTVFGKAAANGNNKEFKVIYGATNVSPLTDGTVTVTGGTTIGDTGVLTTNNGGLLLTCQLFYRTAGNEESMTTAIVGGGTHAGVGTWTDQTFDMTAAANIAITARATTTATDIVYQGSECTGWN